jgi:hypothetical protein
MICNISKIFYCATRLLLICLFVFAVILTYLQMISKRNQSFWIKFSHRFKQRLNQNQLKIFSHSSHGCICVKSEATFQCLYTRTTKKAEGKSLVEREKTFSFKLPSDVVRRPVDAVHNGGEKGERCECKEKLHISQ